MPETRQLDRFEKRLRFGCGSVVGVVLGFVVAAQIVRPDWSAAVVIVPIAIGCGALAVRYGDPFWRIVMDCFRWFA
jgi:hypothetical protein